MSAAYLGARGKHAVTADAVMEHICGGEAAKVLVQRVRAGVALPDELHDALTQHQGLESRFRGFARELQKALEQQAAGAQS